MSATADLPPTCNDRLDDLAATVARVKAMQPDPARRPADYLDGHCHRKFTDLCAWKGYESARWLTEHMLTRVPGLPGDCLLFTTFMAFLVAERQTQNIQV